VRILVTRPAPGAQATAMRLAALGHAAVLAPCLAITPLPARLPKQIGALIITSGQAVPALPADLADVPVFCVGDATAARLRDAGFHKIESAAGDAQDLAALIIARRLPGTHVMAVGARHGLWLARQLRAAGISLIRRSVYAARPVRALPGDVLGALEAGEVDAVLFYSADSARAFIGLYPAGTAGLRAFALSEAVARPLRDLPWREIRVALAPNEAAMMALIA